MHLLPPQDDQLIGPSDRSFGLVFTVVFALVGALPLWDGDEPRWWAIALSVLLLILALVRPPTLAPANRIWFRIGRLMHRVVNPVVMAGLYFGAVTPFGLVRRAFRGGLRRSLRPDRGVPSYWVAPDDRTFRMDQPF